MKHRRDYVAALEEERRKILVFQRELPLSLELVNTALEAMKESLGGPSDHNRYEPGSSHSLVKLVSRLAPEAPTAPVCVLSGTRHGGAFQPFQRRSGATGCVLKAPRQVASVSEEGDDCGPRKRRRCWSEELHRRFIRALAQLGGAHVATPKQIRELMKVEDLTNDEVKSHLQKYRLHNKRQIVQGDDRSLAPQIVVVGEMWVPHAARAEGVVPAEKGGKVGSEDDAEYCCSSVTTSSRATTNIRTSNELHEIRI